MLHASFKMKNLGELKYFLWIESEKCIVLSQKKYALELISKVGLSGGKVNKMPMELNLKLTKRKYDEHLKINQSDKSLDDASLYRRQIGKLLYLTIN